MVGMKSPATVQQMQPFASSTMFSSGQLASAQDFRISPSTPSLPNSLTSTASFLPLALAIKCRISVVLPEPRKPVMTVTGILASEVTLQPPIRTTGGNARQRLLSKDFRSRTPGHDAIGGGGIGGGAGNDVACVFFRQPPVNIGPAAGRAERDRATLVAGGQALDRHHVHAGRRAGMNDGLMQKRTRRGLPLRNGLTGAASDADVKRDGHRPSLKPNTSAGRGDAAGEPPDVARFPSRDTPSPGRRKKPVAGLPAFRGGVFLPFPPSRALWVSASLA